VLPSLSPLCTYVRSKHLELVHSACSRAWSLLRHKVIFCACHRTGMHNFSLHDVRDHPVVDGVHSGQVRVQSNIHCV
jgi:hypothetical protein